MLPEPDILIGCGTMPELRREGILEGAPRYRLVGIQNLICSARCGRKRYRHHGIGIALESRVVAMDLEIRHLLAMASELPAAMASELPAAMFAKLFVLMLVNLLVVMPPDFEQTPVLNIFCSFLSGR